MHPENCSACGEQQHSPHLVTCAKAYPDAIPMHARPIYGIWMERESLGMFWGALSGGPAHAFTLETATRTLDHHVTGMTKEWSSGVAFSVRPIPKDYPSRIVTAADVAIVGYPRPAALTAAAVPAPPAPAAKQTVGIGTLGAHIDEGIEKLARALGHVPSPGMMFALALSIRDHFGAIETSLLIKREAPEPPEPVEPTEPIATSEAPTEGSLE